MARSVSYTFAAIDHFTGVASKIKASVNDITGRVKNLNSVLNDKEIKKSIGELQNSVSGFAKKWSIASAAVTAFSGMTVVAAAKNEVMRKSFDVLTGSVEKGGELIRDLYDFAERTPFEVTELGDAAKMLLAMGIETDKVIDSLSMLGDMAAAVDRPINEFALVYGQIMSTTFLTGGDAMQLTNKGIGIREMIAKKLNVDMATVYDLISQRMISSKFVENLLKELTSEGGRFYNMMDERSATLQGRWSNMLDAWDALKITIGAILIQHLDLKGVVTKITEGIKWLGDAISAFASEHPQLFKFTMMFVGILVVLGPIVLALTTMVGAIIAAASASGVVASAIAIAVAATAFWTTATAFVYAQWETLGPYLIGIWEEIVYQINLAVKLIKFVTWPTRKLLEFTGIINTSSSNQTDINVNIGAPNSVPVHTDFMTKGGPNINVGLNMAGAR